jgi:hypothetical protein
MSVPVYPLNSGPHLRIERIVNTMPPVFDTRQTNTPGSVGANKRQFGH